MIVYQTGSLHKGITNGASNKLKPTLAQVSTHRIRFRTGGWDIFLVLPFII